MAALTREEIVTIRVLTEKNAPARAIARQLGITEGAVRYHQRRQRSGAVDGRSGKPYVAEMHAAVIDEWAERLGGDGRPVNARDLYEYLVETHGYASSYKSVLRYVRSRFGRPPMRTYRRVETPPGAQAQTDWGEFPRMNIGSGPQMLHAFVMQLSHSRAFAVVWSEREDQLSWLSCHNRAFERLGGIPAVNRIDNVKTAISRGSGPWGEIHPVYRAYANSVRFHVHACVAGSPEQKGKVERKVRLVRGFVRPMGNDFAGIGHLQSLTDDRILEWCDRAICPATGKSVRETWEEEKRLLQPLPRLPEPFDVSVVRPVHKDCTVHFEQRQYSVPFRYVGRTVDVRGCNRRVQIFFGNELIVEHPRGTDRRLVIDPSCYEGASTPWASAPPPPGKMAAAMQAILDLPVERRPLDLYAALAEVAR
jgi:transposase